MGSIPRDDRGGQGEKRPADGGELRVTCCKLLFEPGHEVRVATQGGSYCGDVDPADAGQVRDLARRAARRLRVPQASVEAAIKKALGPGGER